MGITAFGGPAMITFIRKMAAVQKEWLDRLRLTPWFSRAIGGMVCSFVGLLLSVTIRYTLNIHWDLAHVTFAAVAFAALVFEIDILWVSLQELCFPHLFFKKEL
jgi:chromate transport protein ChrA